MKKVGSDALRNLPVAGTLLGLVAIAALGLAYWGNVTSRERYLQSRNFRLLTDVAEQTQTILYDSEQIVRRTIDIARFSAADEQAGDISSLQLDKIVADRWARKVISLLQATRQSRDGHEDKTPADRRVAPIELWRGETMIQPSIRSVSETAQQFKKYRTRVFGMGADLRFDWMAADKGPPNLSFQLPAAALFAGSFTQARWDRAFSTMALATADGRIVFAVGPEAAELKASGVAALLPAASEKELLRFASAIANEPVRNAGIDARMFTQPCCRADSLTLPVNSTTPGLVLVGLSDADALRSLSLAISPVLVLWGTAFVIACLVGWAFLKCLLMGVQQRLGRHDVISMLVSGLFGVALATILLLTMSAYTRLRADFDVQLKHLSSTLSEKFSGEIEGAARQLKTMVDVVRTDECSRRKGSQPGSGRLPDDPCQRLADPWSKSDRPKFDFGYRDFITFAMVDEAGLQAVKAAFSAATGTIVDVSARAYYQHARTREQLWSLPPRPDRAGKAEPLCPDGCYLEYVSSWNTGRRQVVVSMPTNIDRLPVATLSIPMHSLLTPVLPPGFEFAVVDSAGVVQFHSDPQRNGQENLLLETDQNPRLLSLLAARSAGTFNTMYWGYPYRSYVRPTGIPGWSIVVFHSKQATRALVLEWFIVAMLLTSLYTLGWAVVMLFSLRPGAPWLWPDPLRRHWYVPLGCLALIATAVWLAIVWRKPAGVTAVVGVVIPILTWAIVYVVLAVRPAGAGEVKQWTELCRGYRFAGTALLLLTAAVPAASFYALSFDRHIEAFVKERQIGLARLISAAVECKDVNTPNEHVVRYDHPAHDGEVTCVEDAREPAGNSAIDSYIHEAFEDAVPYFTSASIALRELMHEKSADRTWFSYRNVDRMQALQLRAGDSGSRLQVAADLPAIVGWHETVHGGSVVVLAAVALVMLVAVVGVAYFVIAFLVRRVLLADVVEPIRRRVRIVTQVGQHLQIICLDPAWLADRVNDLYLLRVTPAANGPDARTLDDVRRDVSEAPASQRIGISDLEASPDDALVLEKKLEIVESVMDLPNQTVLLFTRSTTRELDTWIRERCESSANRDRWSRLIARLRVTELPPRSETTVAERWTLYLRNLVQGWREEFISRWQDWRAPLRWRARLLEREGQSDPKIDEIATELQKSPAFVSGSLTRDQILEEIEESADQYYREIWKVRSEDERVLLEHVARHGLASAASRRVVRKLLAAGLLRKDPELRLMSESFRRFVLEPERRQEVAALEQQAAPSLWDRLRVPLAVSGTLALLFLLVTQRAALDTTVSVALGVTTAVPTLVKLTNLLAQLGVKGGPKANA